MAFCNGSNYCVLAQRRLWQSARKAFNYLTGGPLLYPELLGLKSNATDVCNKPECVVLNLTP